MAKNRTQNAPDVLSGEIESGGLGVAERQAAAPPTVNGEPVEVVKAKRTRKPKAPDPWLLSVFTDPASGAQSVAALAETMPDYIEQMIEHRSANGNVKGAYRLFHCQPAYQHQ